MSVSCDNDENTDFPIKFHDMEFGWPRLFSAEKKQPIKSKPIPQEQSVLQEMIQHPPALFPEKTGYLNKLRSLRDVVADQGSWVMTLGKEQIQLAEALAVQNATNPGVSSEDFFLELVNRRTDENVAFFAEQKQSGWGLREMNGADLAELEALTNEDIRSAEAFINRSALPDEMKRFFAVNVALAEQAVANKVVSLTWSESGEIWMRARSEAYSEEIEQAKKRATGKIEALVSILSPIYAAKEGEATERLRAEYRERHLEPTLAALFAECPGLNQEALRKRAQAFTVEAAGNVASWDSAGGKYFPGSRRIYISMKEMADRARYDHAMSHEILHGLSQKDAQENEDAIILRLGEECPPEYTAEEWRVKNIALTEAVTEELNGRLLKRRFGDAAPRSVYDDFRAALSGSFDDVSAGGVPFSLRDVAPAYFGDGKNIGDVWPKDAVSQAALKRLINNLARPKQ